jgi:hypothetical protein
MERVWYVGTLGEGSYDSVHVERAISRFVGNRVMCHPLWSSRGEWGGVPERGKGGEASNMHRGRIGCMDMFGGGRKDDRAWNSPTGACFPDMNWK